MSQIYSPDRCRSKAVANLSGHPQCPLWPKTLNFMQHAVFWKIWQNHIVAIPTPPPPHWCPLLQGILDPPLKGRLPWTFSPEINTFNNKKISRWHNYRHISINRFPMGHWRIQEGAKDASR